MAGFEEIYYRGEKVVKPGFTTSLRDPWYECEDESELAEMQAKYPDKKFYIEGPLEPSRMWFDNDQWINPKDILLDETMESLKDSQNV